MRIFVLTKNYTPLFYSKSEKNALDKTNELINEIKRNYSEYILNIERTENVYKIYGSNKHSVVKIEKLLDIFSVTEISELEQETNEKEEKEETEENEEKKTLDFWIFFLVKICLYF